MEYVLSFDLGIRNLAVCALGITPLTEKLPYGVTDIEFAELLHVYLWEVIDILEETSTTGCKEVSIDAAAAFLLNALERRRDALFQFGVCVGVVIEQQPGGKFVNVRMKALSHVLQSFFHIHTRGTIPICFLSAKRKLKGMSTNVATTETDAKTTAELATETATETTTKTSKAAHSKYKANKTFALDQTRTLLDKLGNGTDANELFNSVKKKDDLADAFLQGVRYMYDHYVNLKPPRKRKASINPSQKRKASVEGSKGVAVKKGKETLL